MESPVILTIIILACAASGALGYYLGRKQGLMEGTLNGAMTVLTQSERFIRIAQITATGVAADAEANEDEDN